jgi:hypothetical protein
LKELLRSVIHLRKEEISLFIYNESTDSAATFVTLKSASKSLFWLWFYLQSVSINFFFSVIYQIRETVKKQMQTKYFPSLSNDTTASGTNF